MVVIVAPSKVYAGVFGESEGLMETSLEVVKSSHGANLRDTACSTDLVHHQYLVSSAQLLLNSYAESVHVAELPRADAI